MLKVKRDDYLELNNEDGKLNLDNVNDLFKKISENYKMWRACYVYFFNFN